MPKKSGMNATLLSQYVSGTKKPSAKHRENLKRNTPNWINELSGINLLQTA